MSVLRVGSSGPDVTALQKLLNERLDPSPSLMEDGVFGPETRKAVIAFQRANWLRIDGIVGLCTSVALLGKERFVVQRLPYRLIAQPTPHTCWAASAAMLTGLNVKEVIAQARAAGVRESPNGGIYEKGADSVYTENIGLLAGAVRLQIRSPHVWLPEELAHFLGSHGPLMMDTVWQHVRVIAGLRGDGTFHGTTLLIYDPWPPRYGRIKSVTLSSLLGKDIAASYHIIHRRIDIRDPSPR